MNESQGIAPLCHGWFVTKVCFDNTLESTRGWLELNGYASAAAWWTGVTINVNW